jgi:hypothetical protein
VSPDPFFIWLEATPLSTWMRESPSLLALPGVLTLHTLAMGFIAGVSLVVALRLLGVARDIPLAAIDSCFPIVWGALAVNAITGVLLVAAYPTKALTNQLFYVKLAIVALGVGLLPGIRRVVRSGGLAPSRKTALVAITSVLLWTAAIVVGRLLPYTYHRLLAIE